MHATQRILTIGIAAALAAGCGGGGGGSEPSVSAPPAPPAANTAPTVSTERLVVVTSGAPATITATGTDADGDTLSYSWTQTSGTPIANPQGASSASFSFAPAAGLPSSVETLSFQVSISDGSASASSSIDVLVARDASLAAFVDGTNGDDMTGDGSVANPFATIEAAVDANSATDIYVMSLPNDASYDETGNILVLSGGRSLFGGFDAEWRRDVVDNRSIVVTDYTGIRYQSIGQPAEISGFDVRAIAPLSGDLNGSNPYVSVRAFVADELRKKGIASAAKKASRDAAEGIVGNYIHMGGKVGVLVEINCETDFVAKNEEFQEFVRDIAMHIAAAAPVCVSREEVDPALVEKEKAIAADQFKDKPAAAVQKIVEGKMDKFYSTVALLEQSYVIDPDQTVQQLLTAKIA